MASFSCTMLAVLICTLVFVWPNLVQSFSVDFIHRDSPKSPYHQPMNSRYETLHQSFLRSFSRAEYLKAQVLGSKKAAPFAEPIQSHITSAAGEFLMEISIGTPPLSTLAIADTGSDLTWTQCKPCPRCYKQYAPLFDPRQSKTFRKLPCDSKKCYDLQYPSCDIANNCEYQYSYGDQSYTIGDLASETLTFHTSSSRKNVSIPNVAFGCGHENAGTFNGSGSGIVGLGGGSLSIINQLGRFVSGRFSYCLVPAGTEESVSSKISFGTTAVVSGPETVSTPLFKKSPDTFYYLNIEGISVAGTTSSKKLSSSVKASSDDGNIIIDSGTTLTYLPQEIYTDLESNLKEIITGTPVSDPQGLFGLCYQATEDIQFPDLVVHFTGADVQLPSSSIFLQVSDEAICLTMVPSDDLAIYGNLSQQNYHIGYDLVEGKVSFQPTDCTKVV